MGVQVDGRRHFRFADDIILITPTICEAERILAYFDHASETWALRKQDENAVSDVEPSIERVMLGISSFTQVRVGIRNSTLEQSMIRDTAAYAKLSKIRWAGHVIRHNRWTRAVSDWTPRDVKRATGRPWSDAFTKSFRDRCDALRIPRTDRIHWTTLAPERDK